MPKAKKTILLLFFVHSIFCQNVFENLKLTKQQNLDSLFSKLYNYNQFNGNILIAENNEIIYKKSFGYCDISKQVPNTENSMFCISSIAKIITSTAIFQLVEKHKIKLNDKLNKYLLDFPYSEIAIRHLLSHTSGLPDAELFEEQIKQHPDKIFTNKDLIPILKLWKKPLIQKPGEKWNYSKTNYMLLALLVEKITKTSFEKYVRKCIFEPAGMQNTFFTTEIYNQKNKAENHEYPFLFSIKPQNVDSLEKYHWYTYNISGFVGQGNIVAITTDLLKFDEALYNGKILSKKTMYEAFTPIKLLDDSNAKATSGATFGLGWFIKNDTTTGKIVYHTGGQPGAFSIFLRNIDKHQTVVIFDNAFNKNIYQNGWDALNILNGKVVKPTRISLVKEYSKSLLENGIEAGFVRLKQLQADSTNYFLSEDDQNELGLQLLYAGNFQNNKQLALEVLKLNTLFFPNSFNTYDSYGEALAHLGFKNEAIFMYNKSLELNPENWGGKKALAKLKEE
jgi:CubicO group peptidase (beta-lactamase class C family)